MKKDVLKPKGKKIYTVEDLSTLPIVNGELHVDGILMGPDGRWWIDEEGNAYFSGEMTVLEDVDPQYIQLDNQTSTPAGMPNLSLWVNNQTLKFRESTGTDTNVPLGPASGANHPTVYSSIHNNTEPGTDVPSGGNVESVSITPSSTSTRIMVMAFWTGCDDTNSISTKGVPEVRLRRSIGATTTLVTWNSSSTTLAAPTHFGGAMFYVDHPNTTSSVTYRLWFDDVGSEKLLHSSLVVFECKEGTA